MAPGATAHGSGKQGKHAPGLARRHRPQTPGLIGHGPGFQRLPVVGPSNHQDQKGDASLAQALLQLNESTEANDALNQRLALLQATLDDEVAAKQVAMAEGEELRAQILSLQATLAGETEAKAYPVTHLNSREMVIDSLEGIPILVTW